MGVTEKGDGGPVRRIVSEISIAAGTPIERVWAVMTDLGLMPGLHSQVLEAWWLDDATEAAAGARFASVQASPELGIWRATSQIIEFRPHRAVGWTIESDTVPPAVCRFEILDKGGHVLVRQSYTVDLRPFADPPIAAALAAEPTCATEPADGCT